MPDKKLRTFISGYAQTKKEIDSRNSQSRTRTWVMISGFGQGVNGAIYKLESMPKKAVKKSY
jgi:hypothetical protein